MPFIRYLGKTRPNFGKMFGIPKNMRSSTPMDIVPPNWRAKKLPL